jgi:hypothetical protein
LIAPGILAALLALGALFVRGRRPALLMVRVIPLRRGLPLRHAA